MLGFTAIDADVMSSVSPSARALLTASVAMVPFAAGRFSTMTDCPSWDCNSFAITRATESGAPAANGTTMATVRLGYCAEDAPPHETQVSARAARAHACRILKA